MDVQEAWKNLADLRHASIYKLEVIVQLVLVPILYTLLFRF